MLGRTLLLLGCVGSISVAGCNAGKAVTSGNGGSGASGSQTGTSGGPSTGPGSGTMSTGTSFMTNGASTGTGMTGPATFYIHTNTMLYTLDPAKPSTPPVQVGAFDCIGSGANQDSSMTDIAVSSTGAIWAVSAHNVYSITVANGVAHCAQTIPIVGAGATFYALTFAPVGVLDPAKEVLVAGNSAGELWSVDATGNVAEHGTFGTVPANDGHGHTYLYPGTQWEISGDIVFLSNNGNPIGFATIRDCKTPPSSSTCNKSDTLVQLNMSALKSATTGSITQAIRGEIVGSGSMYGISAYQDKVFGFSHSGDIVEINNSDGTPTVLQSLGTNFAWAGAGVSTSVQIIPPS
jgi:hypothetical protein